MGRTDGVYYIAAELLETLPFMPDNGKVIQMRPTAAGIAAAQSAAEAWAGSPAGSSDRVMPAAVEQVASGSLPGSSAAAAAPGSGDADAAAKVAVRHQADRSEDSLVRSAFAHSLWTARSPAPGGSRQLAAAGSMVLLQLLVAQGQ